ncbi:MAG: type IX secretion system membrane protein PorP/SprF [Bacteroidetes bacterium]|nr:type IX secretion system membrane protein PorP/SprF [Bacteroidota bacterium]
MLRCQTPNPHSSRSSDLVRAEGLLFHDASVNFNRHLTYPNKYNGKQKNILVVALFRYRLSDDSKYTGLKQAAYISLGCLYRHADAFCFPVKLDIKNYSVGFNYDLNVSSLARSSKAIGAFEICLSFHSVTPYLYQKKSNP